MNPIAMLAKRVLHEPKEHVASRVRKMCDDMPPRRRLIAVAALLSVFILTAFIVFGHACYRMGARRAVVDYEISHMRHLDINVSQGRATPGKLTPDSAYDSTGIENED